MFTLWKCRMNNSSIQLQWIHGFAEDISSGKWNICSASHIFPQGIPLLSYHSFTFCQGFYLSLWNVQNYSLEVHPNCTKVTMVAGEFYTWFSVQKFVSTCFPVRMCTTYIIHFLVTFLIRHIQKSYVSSVSFCLRHFCFVILYIFF